MAPAVAPTPRLVLMDEPFSNLDMELRKRLANDFHQLLKGQGVTALSVTRDPHERFMNADGVETAFAMLRGSDSDPSQNGQRVLVLLRSDDLVPDPEGTLAGEVVVRPSRGRKPSTL